MLTINDIIIRKPTDQEVKTCKNWPVWTCGVSEFDWEYTQTEKCLILEGQVTVKAIDDANRSVSFGPGDYVMFPNTLKCIWKITEPVKKHYDFE